MIERRGGLDLSRHQMRELSILNLPDGSMWPELVARRRDGRECTVYYSRNGVGHIVAWALVYHTPNLGGYDFHVYVDAHHRRQGYGSRLHAAATDEYGVVRTFAPGDDARNFYASLDNRRMAG